MTDNKPSKLDTLLFQKILKKESESQIQQKYLQNTLLMNVFYSDNIKNSYNSKVRRQINWKIGKFGAKDLNRHLTKDVFYFIHSSSVQSLSHVWLFATPWIAARQASLSITVSQSSHRLTSIKSVMPSSHLIFGCPLLLLPLIPPNIKVFSNMSTLRMRWPE